MAVDGYEAVTIRGVAKCADVARGTAITTFHQRTLGREPFGQPFQGAFDEPSVEQLIECAFLELQPPANLLADAVDCFRVEVMRLVRGNPTEVHRSTDAG